MLGVLAAVGVGSMIGGSILSHIGARKRGTPNYKPYNMKAPTEPAFRDFVNLISGTATEKVKKPDGSYMYRTIRTPLTPEQRALRDQFMPALMDGLKGMHYLAHKNPQDLVDYMPYLGAITNLDSETRRRVDKLQDEAIMRKYVSGHGYAKLSKEQRLAELDRVKNEMSIQSINEQIEEARQINDQVFEYNYRNKRNALKNELAARGQLDSSESMHILADFDRNSALERSELNLSTQKHYEELADTRLNRGERALGIRRTTDDRLLDAEQHEIAAHTLDQAQQDEIFNRNKNMNTLYDKIIEGEKGTAKTSYDAKRTHYTDANAQKETLWTRFKDLTKEGAGLENTMHNRLAQDPTAKQALDSHHARENLEINKWKEGNQIVGKQNALEENKWKNKPPHWTESVGKGLSHIGGQATGYAMSQGIGGK